MLVMVNVDNIAGDILPYLIDRLLDIGAKNVHVIQALTKKGRLGYLLLIDTVEEYLDSIADFLASEVGTLGVRVLESQHRPYDYTIQQVCLSVEDEDNQAAAPYEIFIDVKLVVNESSEVLSARAEHSHIEAACKELHRRGYGIPFIELKARAELAALEEYSPQAKRIRLTAVRSAPCRPLEEEGNT